jgi:plastocyanin
VAYSRIDPATAGVVEGVIHFDRAAPKRIEIDMAQDPACAMAGGTNLSEGYVVDDGKMANVFVSVTSGLGDKVYAPSSAPVVLDQKGCRYVPHVIGVQVGQPVEFRNSDPTMHNIHMEPQVAGNQPFDISQAPSVSGTSAGGVRHVFTKAETMIPVRCNNHPWMQAFINVADNPFFAVSDASGHYSITGLPPGVYTLTAVQEQLGKQQATVTVTAHGVATSDFHFGAGGS